MREIKFRAWDSQSEEPRMVDWETLLQYYHIELVFREKGEDSHVHLMQFTGLKDKNGKEIYEGDIVGFDKKVAKVLWQENGFYVHRLKDGDFDVSNSNLTLLQENTYWEVIGNIYENKELLK